MAPARTSTGRRESPVCLFFGLAEEVLSKGVTVGYVAFMSPVLGFYTHEVFSDPE